MSHSRQSELEMKNLAYRDRYALLINGLIVVIVIVLLVDCLVLYQVTHRPLPLFYASMPNGQKMQLTTSMEPNLQPDTLIRWASKAAVAAYTFSFDNYQGQFELARPYFTTSGWSDYLASVDRLITNITEKQLIVNGVVAGPPVISHQGDLPGYGYVWRIQIPFLVTYQSAGQATSNRYTVIVTIVRVPTSVNPAGIGINQFVME